MTLFRPETNICPASICTLKEAFSTFVSLANICSRPLPEKSAWIRPCSIARGNGITSRGAASSLEGRGVEAGKEINGLGDSASRSAAARSHKQNPAIASAGIRRAQKALKFIAGFSKSSRHATVRKFLLTIQKAKRLQR
ncbi:MAG: hypothetical protein V4710_08115 [Verrucomicrobiota bacterium]